MDIEIVLAARALAAGDVLGSLKRVALRNDPPALALRGIAMARLGDFNRARVLLKRAVRGFGPNDTVKRARCLVAIAEIALVSRDLSGAPASLEAARMTLEAHGDRLNAAHAAHLEVRRLLLVGRPEEAERALARVEPAPLPPALRAAHELVVAGVALRHLRTTAAREALARAESAASVAGIAALSAEVKSAASVLRTPAARLIAHGRERLLRLDEVEALLASPTLIVDTCRHVVRDGRAAVSLVRRPVLLDLARILAEAWPSDVSRGALITRVFEARVHNESHRGRLRVEMGRLRRKLVALADVSATMRGFALTPRRARDVVVLTWPVEDQHARLRAFLADGESWSSSGLAVAMGASQRTVQRGLDALAAQGKVQSLGRGRARRWTTSPALEIATSLLLPFSLVMG
jgi:hypothetical protein